jgi:hypothetical protein
MTLFRHLLSALVMTLAVMNSRAAAGSPEAKTATPLTWRITETGFRTYIATWTWDKENKCFAGRWTNGSVATLKVKKLAKNQVVLVRNDSEGMTEGLTARYVGKEQGNNIKGTVEWTFNGQTTKGTWQAFQIGNGLNNQVAPLDKSRFPAEREVLESPGEQKSFPYLGTNFEVVGPSTATYNCIAHSLGIHYRWVNPQTGPSTNPLSLMDQMYKAQGYVRMSRMDFRREDGKEKVVVYATLTAERNIKSVTHAAIQSSDGTWTSKLGKLALIRHLTPQALNGPVYGQPVAVYVRSRS